MDLMKCLRGQYRPTPEQFQIIKDKFKNIPKAGPLKKELKKLKEDLFVKLKGSLKDEEIQKDISHFMAKRDELFKLQDEIFKIRMERFLTIRSQLNPDQRKKLDGCRINGDDSSPPSPSSASSE